MSEVVENVGEQNSAPSKEEAAQPTEAVIDLANNVEAVAKAVPSAAEAVFSATNENVEESALKAVAEDSAISPKVDSKKTPVKRTPTKRLSFIERAQKESEELVKTMGGSLEIEGGRRTRSSTRGTPTRTAAASTPPPAKKARSSPASGASTPTRARGRGRKIDTTVDDATEEETIPVAGKKKTPAKGKKGAAKEAVEDEGVEEKSEDSKEEEQKHENSESAAKDNKEDSEAVQSNEDESKETPASSGDSKETPVSSGGSKETAIEIEDLTEENELENKENKSEDIMDAALETVVEETQSQVAAESTSTEKVTNEPTNSLQIDEAEKVLESAKNEGFMDTEEPTTVCSATAHNVTETPAKSVEEVTEVYKNVKEPTPEPMEIDYSPNSSDDVKEIENVTPEVAKGAQTIEIRDADKPLLESTAKESSANIYELNNVKQNEESVQQYSVEPIAATSADVINNSIDAKFVGAPASADVADNNEKSTEETSPAANGSNKTENDLCEPKIATSPPISASSDNSNTTTPQTCN